MVDGLGDLVTDLQSRVRSELRIALRDTTRAPGACEPGLQPGRPDRRGHLAARVRMAPAHVVRSALRVALSLLAAAAVPLLPPPQPRRARRADPHVPSGPRTDRLSRLGHGRRAAERRRGGVLHRLRHLHGRRRLPAARLPRPLRGTAVGLVDVPDPAGLFLPDQPVERFHNAEADNRDLDLVSGTRAAIQLLERYQRRLDRVVTSRLHAYLPVYQPRPARGLPALGARRRALHGADGPRSRFGRARSHAATRCATCWPTSSVSSSAAHRPRRCTPRGWRAQLPWWTRPALVSGLRIRRTLLRPSRRCAARPEARGRTGGRRRLRRPREPGPPARDGERGVFSPVPRVDPGPRRGTGRGGADRGRRRRVDLRSLPSRPTSCSSPSCCPRCASSWFSGVTKPTRGWTSAGWPGTISAAPVAAHLSVELAALVWRRAADRLPPVSAAELHRVMGAKPLSRRTPSSRVRWCWTWSRCEPTSTSQLLGPEPRTSVSTVGRPCCRTPSFTSHPCRWTALADITATA